MSVQSTCNFGLEIIIAYWLFFGGRLLVLSWPDLRLMEGTLEFKGLTWMRSIDAILVTLVRGHCAWFLSIGYDLRFARMPCGSVHVLFRSLSEQLIILLRLPIALWTSIEFIELLISYPFMFYICATEIRRSVMESPIFKFFFPRYQYVPVGQEDSNENNVYMMRRLAKLRRRVYRKLVPRLRRRFIRMFLEEHINHDRQTLWATSSTVGQHRSPLI